MMGSNSSHKQCLEYITNHRKLPEEYIIEKFKSHDIIFVGEMHRVKHDLELIKNLIPVLHQNGINTLAIEFARQKEQELIDKLINSSTYDEDLARHIIFKKSPTWGYQEYVNIFKSAWRLNNNIPRGREKFRVLGISDSPDWGYVKTEDDRRNREVMQKVMSGQGERSWSECIMREVLDKGRRALVYCGLHHAFTGYKQPMVIDNEFRGFNEDRCGRYIYNEIGDKTMTVCLHQPWIRKYAPELKLVYPANGVIDEAMDSMGGKSKRVGFDITGTPFENLPGGYSIYRNGYDHFKLGMFCDGYIYQKSFEEYESVTPIEGFINESNIEEARKQVPIPRFKDASIEQFNEAIASDTSIIKNIPDFLNR